ncbi:hypothetical protein [Pseudarthrobacter sp. NPDC058119]|jgi:hypothetical protein
MTAHTPNWETDKNHPAPRYATKDAPWTPPRRQEDRDASSEYTGEKLRD